MNTIQKGKAGESLVVVRLLLKGYSVFTAVADDGKVDLIYINHNGENKRVQVKTFFFVEKGGLCINVRKMHTNSKGSTARMYTSEDVDEFAAVNVETGEVFLIPISFVSSYKATIFYQTVKKNFAVI